jgi:deazaflavin-dependent oxidoreductase (nitroreductase family)
MQYNTERRVFRYLNRYFMVPAFRAGLGAFIANPFTGYIMVLKTIGHKSGQERYTPANYAIRNGAVYCLAGFGQTAHWYRNLQANPRVELMLPNGNLSGWAEEVTDPDERLGAIRQVLKNGGFAGFFFGFNPFTASDKTLVERCANIPVMRIRPAGIQGGPADPGGWWWVMWAGLGLLPLVVRWMGKRRKT